MDLNEKFFEDMRKAKDVWAAQPAESPSCCSVAELHGLKAGRGFVTRVKAQMKQAFRRDPQYGREKPLRTHTGVMYYSISPTITKRLMGWGFKKIGNFPSRHPGRKHGVTILFADISGDWQE